MRLANDNTILPSIDLVIDDETIPEAIGETIFDAAEGAAAAAGACLFDCVKARTESVWICDRYEVAVLCSHGDVPRWDAYLARNKLTARWAEIKRLEEVWKLAQAAAVAVAKTAIPGYPDRHELIVEAPDDLEDEHPDDWNGLAVSLR